MSTKDTEVTQRFTEKSAYSLSYNAGREVFYGGEFCEGLPAEVGGRETGGRNLLVSDAVSVYSMAKAAGAEIVGELTEMPYGGKAFSCRDPEGYSWWVGEYDPWASS